MPLYFDATGFQQQDQQTWVNPTTGDFVVMDYFPVVPDLPATLDDLPRLRHELTIMHGKDGCLIEAYAITFAGVPALLRLIKNPLPNAPAGQVFTAVITVPKATCSVNLQLIAPERGTTGIREAMLMAQVGPHNWFVQHPYVPGFTSKLPYHVGDDVRWDPQFPEHPLTRARAWLHHVLNTGRVDPAFAALPPFQGPQPTQAQPQPTQAQPQPVQPQSQPVQPQPQVQPQPAQPQPAAAPQSVPPQPAAAPQSVPPPAADPAQSGPSVAPQSAAAPAQSQPAVRPQAQPSQAPSQPVQPLQAPSQPAVPVRAGVPVQPQGPLGPGSNLQTVVTGIPVGGILPFWLDQQTCAYFELAEPQQVLGQLGSGRNGRSPLQDNWRRECMLFDVESQTLLAHERFAKEDGGVVAAQVLGRLVSREEASARVDERSLGEAFAWVGRVYEDAIGRNEGVLVGPGGVELYGRPRVLLLGMAGVSRIDASPPPVGAPIWDDQRQPQDPVGPEDNQVLSSPITNGESVRAGGTLAGFAARTWNVDPLHLAVSFKELAG